MSILDDFPDDFPEDFESIESSVAPLSETVGGVVNLLELNLQRILWGSTRTVPAGETETLAYVQVRSYQAKAFSIAINVETIQDFGVALSLSGIATISWGNDGGRHKAEVDIAGGTLFTINGSSIQVAVKNTTVTPLSFSVSLAPVPAGIAISPTRTFTFLAFNGNVRTIIVPPFAKKLLVIRRPESAGVQLIQTSSVLGDVADRSIAAGGNLDIGWPLQPDAASIKIFETVPNTINALAAIFELQL